MYSLHFSEISLTTLVYEISENDVLAKHAAALPYSTSSCKAQAGFSVLCDIHYTVKRTQTCRVMAVSHAYPPVICQPANSMCENATLVCLTQNT